MEGALGRGSHGFSQARGENALGRGGCRRVLRDVEAKPRRRGVRGSAGPLWKEEQEASSQRSGSPKAGRAL